MLDDRERDVLVEIERRLLIEYPELARSFDAVRRHRAPDHRRGARVLTTVAGLTLWVALWRGPRPLTDTEVAIRGAAAPSRRAAEARDVRDHGSAWPGVRTGSGLARRPVPERGRAAIRGVWSCCGWGLARPVHASRRQVR
ncbi:MAG: DUF3040 domain-containing protein [Pseudonocardia sp.]